MTKFQILKNLLIVSLGFLFLFTAFTSLANLQSTLNKEESIGVGGLSVIYGALIISCLFFPSYIIANIGCKWTIALSMLCYILYMAANFYAIWGLIAPSAVILGLGAAPLWSAKCTYLTHTAVWYSEMTGTTTDDVINRFFGIFFMTFQTGQIWGNLVSSTVFSQRGDNATLDVSDLSTCVCGVYIGLALLAFCFIAIFLDKIALDKNKSTKKDNKISFDLLLATFKHWKTSPSQQLITILTIYNYEYLFYIFAAIWGMGDAIIQTQINALYGYLFTDSTEAGFANYRLWESTGFIIAFAYSDFLPTKIKLYICLRFLFLFAPFHALCNLQSTLHVENGVGVGGLAVIYGSVIFSCMFFPTFIIAHIGYKWTIVLSMMCYILYFASNFMPIWAFMGPSAGLLGFGAGPLWSAQSTFLTQLAIGYSHLTGTNINDAIYHFFGIFYGFYQISKYFVDEVGKHFFITFQHWTKHPNQLLLVMPTIYSGIERGFMTGVFTTAYISCSLGLTYIGYVMVCYGLVDAVCSYVFSRLTSCIPSPCFFVIGKYVILFFYIVMIQPEQEYLFYMFGALWGIGDAVIKTHTNANFYAVWGLIGPTAFILGLGAAPLWAGKCTYLTQLATWYAKLTGTTEDDIVNRFFGFFFMFFQTNKPKKKEDGKISFKLFFATINHWWNSDYQNLCTSCRSTNIYVALDTRSGQNFLTPVFSALYGYLFTDKSEAAFSNYRLLESIGFIVAFAYGDFLVVRYKLYICLAVLIVGMLGYTCVEIMDRKNQKREKYLSTKL
ncbi:hypothetical protein KUTeg_019230 [Tegillarca granosa]|uniref:Uncharacterized protein n=1 Tax=Tegillarca granosa TaxID=220873 RepID=A0ABQ9EE12_TEGGR|nr:hypothetical protein KUTeg_019230 [Tegillarca granosa]